MKPDQERLSEQEIEFAEKFAAEHGLAALLDHLGLDGLGNEVVSLARQLTEAERENERLEARARAAENANALLVATERQEIGDLAQACGRYREALEIIGYGGGNPRMLAQEVLESGSGEEAGGE